jgi:outer membrane protein OmpA-like peptidoglycan-associated protein
MDGNETQNSTIATGSNGGSQPSTNTANPSVSAPVATIPESLPGNALPTVYLLTGYFMGGQQNRSTSKLEPMPNTVVFAADPQSATYDAKKPLLLRTDKFGALSTYRDSDLGTRQLFHAHTDERRPILLPPDDVVSFFKAANGKAWKSSLIDELAKLAPTSAMQNIMLEEHAFSNLRKPLDKLIQPDTDKDYRAWHEKLNPDKPVLAYVLAKTRALIFVVNKDLPIDWRKKLEVKTPRSRSDLFESASWLPDDYGDYRMAILSGTKYTLPEGIYKTTIQMNTAVLSLSKRKWNQHVGQPNEAGEQSYRMAEMARFDIKNPAGDFDIINLDPVTVEETLITQYPRFYSHLLSAATSAPQNHESQAPTAGDTTSGTAKINDKAAVHSPGFLDYCRSWSVLKDKSKLAADLISVDLGDYDTVNNRYPGQNKLAFDIAKALHAHLGTEENAKVKASLDAVFALGDGMDAWAEFRTARKDYLVAINSAGGLESWGSALKKHYYGLPTTSPDDLLKYQNSIAGRIGVPKGALDGFGKAMNVVDMATNLNALAKGGYGYFKTVLPGLDSAKSNYKALSQDYFYKLSAKTIKKSVTYKNQFAFNEAIVDPEDRVKIEKLTEGIVEALADDPSLVVTVAGHTCDIGSYDHNMELSKDRAVAVKAVLEGAGVGPGRIDAQGYGYEVPFKKNASDSQRALNRRVVITSHTIGSSMVSPSREGMATLERYRNLSVQRKLGATNAEAALAGQVTDVALGILSVVPLTAPFARAVILLKTGAKAVISLGAALDSAFNDSALKQYFSDQKKIQTLCRETDANQYFIFDLYREYKDKDQVPNDVLWAAQFRVRSEVISGLLMLLMRAALEPNDEAYSDRVAKYYIEAYIENFILNDDWLYPLEGTRTLNMCTYWLFAINNFKSNQENVGYDSKQVQFGLDKNNRLATRAEQGAIKASAMALIQGNTPSAHFGGNKHGMYMMSKAKTRHVENHITTEYQSYFPIHYFDALDFDALGGPGKKFSQFTETFKPAFRDVSTDTYRYTRVYYKDLESEQWVPFIGDNVWAMSSPGYRPRFDLHKITPFTPIRVLIVFNKDMPAVAPLRFTINRIDGYDTQGPIYKELAKELTKDELLSSETDHIGYVGCVCYPFFQLWDKTYLGLKPIVGSTRMGFFPSAAAYHWLGNMDDMRYQIHCQIADNDTTDIVVPLKSMTDKDGNIYLHKGSGHDVYIPDEINMDIDKTRDGEISLIEESFLASGTKEFDYPPLYEGKQWLNMAIKVGKSSPFMAPARYKVRESSSFDSDVFEDEMKETERNTHCDIRGGNPYKIKFKDFNWEDSVEFVCTQGCTSLNSAVYKGKPVDWRSIPFEMSIVENGDWKIGVTEGPTLKSKMVYLGKVTGLRDKITAYDGSGVLREGSGKGCAHDPNLNPILEMLEKVNTGNLSKVEHRKIAALFGHFGEDNRFVAQSWHVFAAHFKCAYESPKGVKVNSIRPFGDDVFDEKGDFDSSVEYLFRNFKSAGNTGLQIEKLFASSDFECRYEFSTPQSFMTGAPWTKARPASETAALKGKIRDEIFDSYSKDGLSEEEVKKWLGSDAKMLTQPLESIFK